MSLEDSKIVEAPRPKTAVYTTSGLRKIAPYWHPYVTYAKERWLNRELLEVVSTEFRDRSVEFYRYALESGLTTINEKIAGPETIVKNGDRIENVVHKHEPPVTSTPVKILSESRDPPFIVVDKPGSIPIHPTGRYYRNTLIDILENEFGYKKVYPVNRLDRLTSGLMILPTSVDSARNLANEFAAGLVHKEYVARVNGKFPSEETVCEEPMLTIDRQMALNVVHPEGKTAKSVFTLIRYDSASDTSIVLCKPFTGRSHQLRVHLQYLGYPISNDPVYSSKKVWGPKLGKGGIDLVPSEERQPPAPPEHLAETVARVPVGDPITAPERKLLPRETGEDIGLGGPVPLSLEAVGIITRLRNTKDEAEDWGRWRDVVFHAKGRLVPVDVEIEPLPQKPQKTTRRQKAKAKALAKANAPRLDEKTVSQDDINDSPSVILENPAEHQDVHSADVPLSFLSSDLQAITDNILDLSDAPFSSSDLPECQSAIPKPVRMTKSLGKAAITLDLTSDATSSIEIPERFPTPPPAQLSTQEALQKITEMKPASDAAAVESDGLYCPECYVPLHPDPKPESLYIFLHALRYTTSLGTFMTDMPHWSREDFVWDGTE